MGVSSYTSWSFVQPLYAGKRLYPFPPCCAFQIIFTFSFMLVIEVLLNQNVCQKYHLQQIEIVNVLEFILFTNIDSISVVMAASCKGRLPNQAPLRRSTEKFERPNLLLIKFGFHGSFREKIDQYWD